MRIGTGKRGVVGRPAGAPSSGKVLVMAALLMPVVVGGLALSVDTAVLATTRAQLQTVGDAAALAGARQLATENRVRGKADISPEMSAARSSAIAIGQGNNVLGGKAVVLDNPSNGASGDIAIGYLSPTDTTAQGLDSAVPQALFNSVRVNATSDPDHGGLVPSYFGNLFNVRGTKVTVSSTATVQNYAITGFKSVNNEKAQLLPIVLDKPTFEAMMAGTTTDQYTYNPTTRAVSPSPDGVEESLLYPVGSGNPGNWGTVNIGISENSTSTLGAQIRDGITPEQLATFPDSTIRLNTSNNPPSLRLDGDTGISAGIEDDLTSIIGRPVTIPIYDKSGANGNNAWYRIIAFAAVRVLDVNFQGNPKYVIVQPALVNDPTAIPGAPQPSWTSGGLIRLHLSR